MGEPLEYNLPIFVQDLLPDQEAFAIDQVEFNPVLITVHLHFVKSKAACPTCHHAARRVHSRYTRTLADLPWAGIPLRWQLTVRHFFCDHPACPQVTFTEQQPSAVARSARRLQRLTEAQRQLGFDLGGEAGQRTEQPPGNGDERRYLVALAEAHTGSRTNHSAHPRSG